MERFTRYWLDFHSRTTRTPADIELTKAGLMKLSVSLCNEMLKLNRNMKQTVMSHLQDPGMKFPTKIEIPCPVKLFG